MKTAKKGKTTFSFGHHLTYDSAKRLRPLLKKADMLVMEGLSRSARQRTEVNRVYAEVTEGKARIKVNIPKSEIKKMMSEYAYNVGLVEELQRSTGKKLKVESEPFSKKALETQKAAEALQKKMPLRITRKATPENVKVLIDEIKKDASLTSESVIERDKKLKDHLIRLRKENPEANILVERGGLHTNLYIDMKKSGENAERKKEQSLIIHNPRNELIRRKVFEEMGLLKNKTTTTQETMLAKRYVIDIVIGALLMQNEIKKLKPQQHENITRVLTNKISDKEVDKIFEEFQKNPEETIAGHISGWIQEKNVFGRIKQEEISRALK